MDVVQVTPMRRAHVEEHIDRMRLLDLHGEHRWVGTFLGIREKSKQYDLNETMHCLTWGLSQNCYGHTSYRPPEAVDRELGDR